MANRPRSRSRSPRRTLGPSRRLVLIHRDRSTPGRPDPGTPIDALMGAGRGEGDRIASHCIASPRPRNVRARAGCPAAVRCDLHAHVSPGSPQGSRASVCGRVARACTPSRRALTTNGPPMIIYATGQACARACPLCSGRTPSCSRELARRRDAVLRRGLLPALPLLPGAGSW